MCSPYWIYNCAESSVIFSNYDSLAALLHDIVVWLLQPLFFVILSFLNLASCTFPLHHENLVGLNWHKIQVTSGTVPHVH